MIQLKLIPKENNEMLFESNNSSSINEQQEIPYERCLGKTLKGKRCKNKGKYENSYCKAHES